MNKTMNKNRLPNLLNSPTQFQNWEGPAIFVGVYTLSLLSSVEHLCVFINMKTGEILMHQSFKIKINASILTAFLTVLLYNNGILYSPNTLIHTPAGHPFNSKVFLTFLKVHHLIGSSFIRAEFAPFYIKLFTHIANNAQGYNSVEEVIDTYNKAIKQVQVSPGGDRVISPQEISYSEGDKTSPREDQHLTSE